MATYTVIQDIEAEDKLLGPLSMRQFIYAIIVVAIGFVAFTLGKINFLLAIPFVVPMGFFGLLAAPFGRDQSSEVWLLAKIRFMFKPRRRIWDQSGLKELVTITVPKVIERHLTDGLDQTQVRSRLSALASTLDSRGWAIKNVSATTYTPPSYALGGGNTGSDRLVGTVAPQAVPDYDSTASDDILDAQNKTSQKFDSLITQSEQARRQQLIANMHTAAQAPPEPAAAAAILPQPAPPTTPLTVQAATPPQPYQTPYTPEPATAQTDQQQSLSEQQLLEQIKANQANHQAANSHIKRIPTAQEIIAEQEAKRAQDAAAAERASELSRLAVNDDLDVATIARQAEKDRNEPHTLGDGEVIISLH